MNQYPLWRYVLLVLLLIVGFVYALPNLYGDDPAIQIYQKDNKVDAVKVITKIKQVLTQQKIPYLSLVKEDGSVLVRFYDTEAQIKAQDVIEASLGTDYSVALNLASRTPKWLLAIGAEPMKLGLDLRGGIHFLLKVDVDALLKTNAQSMTHDVGNSLRQNKIRYVSIINKGKQGILIGFRDDAARNSGMTLLKRTYPDYLYTKSQIGNRPALLAVITNDALIKLRNYAIDQNLTILRNRVNELGVSEPVISRQGANHISVDLPGIQDTARAKDIIGKVATIELRMVDTEHNAVNAKRTGIVPFGSQLMTGPEGQPILLKNQIVLKGSSIINASSTFDSQSGTPAVQVRIKSGEALVFHRITSANVGKPMATVYTEVKTEKKLKDGKVISVPVKIEKVINVAVIKEPLANSFIVSGLTSLDSAKNLALLLRAGAYTAPLQYVQDSVIGPSLGKDNIRMGVMSTLIGGIVVIIFMAIYYRLFGFIADLALILNIVFIVAILSLLSATLTLPGIAGIVLTVGMAVDANVLINERIREELRLGLSPQASIYAGYERAFSTIVDANVTTLIVAVVLLALGSGEVENFAVTLIIGLLTSMVTAIFFTRAIVNLVYGRRSVNQLSIGIRVS